MQDELVDPPAKTAQPPSTPADPGLTDSTLKDGASNPAVLDAVGAGTPEATAETVQHANEGEHHTYFLGLDSYGWVAVAFVIFAGLLIYLKVPRAILGALDAKATKVRGELDEARRLRGEAEMLLGEYAAKRKQAEADAAGILAGAHREAEAIVAAARADGEARVARRARQAEDRIAAAERAAAAELRARVAALATAAAARVIGEDGDAALHRRLNEGAIGELERRLA